MKAVWDLGTLQQAFICLCIPRCLDRLRPVGLRPLAGVGSLALYRNAKRDEERKDLFRSTFCLGGWAEWCAVA